MDILIEESEGALWAAAVKNNTIQSLEIDTVMEHVRWGDIYQGRVKTLDTARDAAFIDLGEGLTGLLYNKNIRIQNADGSVTRGGSDSIGKLLSPGDLIIVQAKTAYIESDNDRYTMENKMPEVSMDVSLQGRYLIYCPMMPTNRISQRVYNKKLRDQMRAMLDQLDDIHGCILRASAGNTQTDLLRREAATLKKGWDSIIGTIPDDEPQILAAGLDAVQRILSDMAGQSINSIEVVTMEHYEYAEQWCHIFAPDLAPKIRPVELENATDDLALFHERDIMDQIDALTKSYFTLPHGGNLIIQSTAALTAIDVNKGQDNRGHLDTNIEAAIHAMRQMRLRNIGGVILLDALKMKNKKEADQFLSVARNEAAKDSCTVQIHGMTGSGLLEITRNRRTPELAQRLQQ